MNEFLEMGGYARYVWPSFGLYVVLLAWLAFSAQRRHRNALRALQQTGTAS